MSLSSWWAASSHRALDGTTDMAKRLAIALGPVRASIRVIDDHVPAMTVQWAHIDEDGRSKSGTDFEHGNIIINPLPVVENKLPVGEQIDIVTGFALHEASHGKHSRSAWGDLTNNASERGIAVPAFSPMKIAAWLWNLAEDVRIEEATMRDWRGTRPYFERILDWVWSERLRRIEADAELGHHETALQEALSRVFVACRFPKHADASDPETGWWQAWQADYLEGRTDVAETIRRGLDHLAIDDEVAMDLMNMAAQEAWAREQGERLREQLQRLLREAEREFGNMCISREAGDLTLTAVDAAAVDRLVEEELVEAVAILGSGMDTPPIWVTKPIEDARSLWSYIGRPDGSVEALRAAIVFRPESPQSAVKLQKRGELDEEELWRWPSDDRLFSERLVESKPDTAMGLLVDMSGSMAGDPLRTAQRLAQLFVTAMHDEEGVETRVWGHTGDVDGANSTEVYRLWEPGDPLSRLGLITSMKHCNNFDGHAIGWCVDQMRHMEQPQKVLFVLSDGLPSGYSYGGRPAMSHVRQITDWAAKQGVDVIQIDIDGGLRPDDQAAMFASWVPYEDDRQLFRDLARLMVKYR